MQGTLYPNGEFTVNSLNPKALRVDKPLGKESQDEASWRSIVAAHVEVYGVQETIRILQQVEDRVEREGMLDVLDRWEESEGSLGLSNVRNSRQNWKSSLRGQRGITTYARRLVRNGAYAIEQQHRKSTLSFLTLTLPPMDGKSFKQFMKEHWSKCTKKFFDWLAARLKRAGLPTHWCGVTEIQMRRFTETGIPYPHLHVVFVGRKSFSGWLLSPSEIRVQWVNILTSTHLPALVRWDGSGGAVENVQQVRKSVEAYLGKYLSKGNEAMNTPAMMDWYGWLPSNWHFISQPIKTWVKQNTKQSETLGNFLCTLCEASDGEWLQWCHRIVIPWGDIELQAGFAGKLVRSRLKWAQNVLETHTA